MSAFNLFAVAWQRMVYVLEFRVKNQSILVKYFQATGSVRCTGNAGKGLRLIFGFESLSASPWHDPLE